jgi:RNA polymerase sigma-54 factor
MIPLRSLLSTAPAADNTRDALELLIKGENRLKPFTDEQLREALKRKGFNLARRTIAKYRNQLKIGSATQRKYL